MNAVDSFGLAIPIELADQVVAHTRAEIDHVEIILERALNPKNADKIAMLGAYAPLCIHGISLGLAGIESIAPQRLRKLAEVVGTVKPRIWSEHLAFVRHQNFEVGHLAVPPRSKRGANVAADNLKRVADAVGSMPLVENTATLGVPPGSTMSEGDWVHLICQASGANLLLDLHNIVTNAFNEKSDAMELLHSMPLDRVREVHLAGGREIVHRSGEIRIVDDHMHAVPTSVFAMLEVLGAKTESTLFVTVEREAVGRHETSAEALATMLADLHHARAALQQGRAQRSNTNVRAASMRSTAQSHDDARDFTDAIVPLLSWIYARPELAERFFSAPIEALQSLRADPAVAELMAKSDLVGLELAVMSFASKRVGG